MIDIDGGTIYFAGPIFTIAAENAPEITEQLTAIILGWA